MLMLLCTCMPSVHILCSKLYDGSSLNHLSCIQVAAWEPILLSIIGNEPQCR